MPAAGKVGSLLPEDFTIIQCPLSHAGAGIEIVPVYVLPAVSTIVSPHCNVLSATFSAAVSAGVYVVAVPPAM